MGNIYFLEECMKRSLLVDTRESLWNLVFSLFKRDVIYLVLLMERVKCVTWVIFNSVTSKYINNDCKIRRYYNLWFVRIEKIKVRDEEDDFSFVKRWKF